MTASIVRIRLLGGFELIVDDELIDEAPPTRRAAELVQLLSVADGHRMLRDQVIEALWPHLGAEAGGSNLRKAAHHARRWLGHDDAVVLRAGEVALFPSSSVQTDVDTFQAAAVEAGEDRERARAAADQYPGDLLPTMLYADWTQPARERLRDLYVDVLRRSGQWRRLVALDPTDEPATRELMREALRVANRHAAIAHYGRLRTALRTEIGVLPSPETDELYAECIAGVERSRGTYIGRQAELAAWESRFRASPDSELSLMSIRGPAGIGKSALCEQGAAIAASEGWRVVRVDAGLLEGPYAVLIALIEQLLTGDLALLDALDERATAVLAELTPMVSASITREGPLTRHQVVAAVRRLLRAAAGHGIVIIVDDAHAVDDASLDVVFHLGSVESEPILTVLSYRPGPAPEKLLSGVERLVRAGHATDLDLDPLSQDEAVALARAVISADAESVRGEIIDAAEGNPFFVLELARALDTEGQTMVSTRHDAIARRFIDLDHGAAAMLRRLALSTGDLDLPIVLALTGMTEDEAFDLLDQALAGGVLVVADGRYRFAHELVRQALVEGIPPHQRVAIHRDAARRLTESKAAPGLIAGHWLDGDRAELAVPWLLAAARRSVELGAFQDAVSYLDPLLEHTREHAEALLLRAESWDALGDRRALAAYAAAARAAGETGAHEIRPRQALATIRQGDPEGALVTLQGSRPVTIEGRLAEALTLSGAAALGFGDPALGATKAAEARHLAFASGDPSAVVTASWAQAAAAHARGELRGSVQVDLRETHDLPSLAVSVFDGQLCITQRLLYGARPYEDVIAFAESLEAEAQRLSAARGQAFARTIAGEAKLLAGRLDEAEADLVLGEQLHRDIGAGTGVAFALQRRAEVAMYQGRSKEARALLDESLVVAEDSDVGFHLLDRIYGTRIAMASTPAVGLAAIEEAEVAVRGTAETCPGCRITLAVPAAIAAAKAGDLVRAAEFEKATVFLAEVVMRLPAWYAALDEVRGHIALAQGHVDLARSHFLGAAETYRDAGQPLDEARCRTMPSG